MRLQNLDEIQKDQDFIYSTVDKSLRRKASYEYDRLIDTGSTPDEALKVIQEKYISWTTTPV